jgi:hypothetical protein
MKKLDKEFESAGFKYKQIHREDMYAIYERCYSNNINKIHYEAIRIQSHNGIIIAGNKIAPSEFYPSNNSWGLHGFTCLTKQDAYKRLDRMMSEAAANKDKAERKKAK